MKTFHLEITTPKGIYMIAEVNELYLKTSLGYMGILANHDTLITGVKVAPGFILLNNKKEYYAIFSGVLNISKEMVKLIVCNIERADSIDLARAIEAKNRATERLKTKSSNNDIKRAEAALKRSLARISAVNRSFI